MILTAETIDISKNFCETRQPGRWHIYKLLYKEIDPNVSVRRRLTAMPSHGPLKRYCLESNMHAQCHEVIAT